MDLVLLCFCDASGVNTSGGFENGDFCEFTDTPLSVLETLISRSNLGVNL